MSGFCSWGRLCAGPDRVTGQSHLTRATQPKQHRRSGESRNPGNPAGKERAGYRGFWIPAFAGTTGLCCDDTAPLILSLSKDAPLDKARWFDKLTMSGFCSLGKLCAGPGRVTGQSHLTRATPSHRRSGESRNPGNPAEKNEPVTEHSGFRLSPKRRFYDAMTPPRSS